VRSETYPAKFQLSIHCDGEADGDKRKPTTCGKSCMPSTSNRCKKRLKSSMFLRIVAGGSAAEKMALARGALRDKLVCNGNHNTSNQNVANTGTPSIMNLGR